MPTSKEHDISSGEDGEKMALGSNNPTRDVEVASEEADGREFGEVQVVRQGLKQRHIQMIALAGTIGTGLFLGSGKAIARSGPLGAFLGYSVGNHNRRSSMVSC